MTDQTRMYTKMTVKDPVLIEAGHPSTTYSEIEGETVVRYVYIMRDGSTVKDSLARYAGEEVYSLAESAPKPEHNWDGNPAFVEMSSKDEFERLWSQAVFMER